MSETSKISKYICIRDAPIEWTEGMVKAKFSHYGLVEEVPIMEPNGQQNSQFIVVEFDCEEDAAGAVEDNLNEGYTVTFYKAPAESINNSSYAMYVTPDESFAKESISFNFIHCSNSNCTGQIVVEEGDSDKSKMFCSPNCYFENIDMMNRVNMYDKWIASMGRSGTGMLKDKDKLDKVIVSVDKEGSRSSKYFPKN